MTSCVFRDPRNDRQAGPRLWVATVALSLSAFWVMGDVSARAASVAPPMLDITRQCDAVSRHNAAAMSECVVAESEARAELFQKWEKLPDVDVQKCIKASRKVRKLPYSFMAKCLAVDQVVLPPPAKPPETAK